MFSKKLAKDCLQKFSGDCWRMFRNRKLLEHTRKILTHNLHKIIQFRCEKSKTQLFSLPEEISAVFTKITQKPLVQSVTFPCSRQRY